MTNNNKNTMNTEQIKNESVNQLDFHKKLKTFLEKDEYDIFKTKAKRLIEQKIIETEDKLLTLKNLKTKSEKVINTLNERKKVLIEENKKLKESLVKKLNLEVKQ